MLKAWGRAALCLAGLACVGVGCWWLSPAAALIVVGCALLADAVWGAVHDPE